jgi:hypothetical protein
MKQPEMTVGDFIRLVAEMRKLQTAFFRSKGDQAALLAARDAEAKVDAVIKDWKAGPLRRAVQGALFEEGQ